MSVCARLCVFKEGNLQAASSQSEGKTGECMQESLYSLIMWVMLQ